MYNYNDELCREQDHCHGEMAPGQKTRLIALYMG